MTHEDESQRVSDPDITPHQIFIRLNNAWWVTCGRFKFPWAYFRRS
jgi:hypothetical protein